MKTGEYVKGNDLYGNNIITTLKEYGGVNIYNLDGTGIGRLYYISTINKEIRYVMAIHGRPFKTIQDILNIIPLYLKL